MKNEDNLLTWLSIEAELCMCMPDDEDIEDNEEVAGAKTKFTQNHEYGFVRWCPDVTDGDFLKTVSLA